MWLKQQWQLIFHSKGFLSLSLSLLFFFFLFVFILCNGAFIEEFLSPLEGNRCCSRVGLEFLPNGLGCKLNIVVTAGFQSCRAASTKIPF